MTRSGTVTSRSVAPKNAVLPAGLLPVALLPVTLIPAGLIPAALIPAALVLAGCGGHPAPPARPLAVTVSASLGRSPAAAAGLVPGFPTDVLPAPPSATVTASAIEPDGELLRVSLTGTSPAPVAAILDFYRATLVRQGFTASDDGVLPPGATGMAYSRGDASELLVVAVVDRGTSRSFSVGGTVRG